MDHYYCLLNIVTSQGLEPTPVIQNIANELRTDALIRLTTLKTSKMMTEIASRHRSQQESEPHVHATIIVGSPKRGLRYKRN